MTVITYKKATNPNISRFQNQVRGKASRIFTSIEEAREFAKTVEVISVYDKTGKRISL